MGSGKSTAGRKIASALGWQFADLDIVTANQQGLTVDEMFRIHGESYFRAAETRALNEISQKVRTVVSCGGGTPCSKENMEVLKRTGVVLYLKMSVPALVSRLLKSKNKRPLLADADEGEMTSRVEGLLTLRSPWYEQADIVTDGLSPDIDAVTGLLADRIRAAGAFL